MAAAGQVSSLTPVSMRKIVLGTAKKFALSAHVLFPLFTLLVTLPSVLPNLMSMGFMTALSTVSVVLLGLVPLFLNGLAGGDGIQKRGVGRASSDMAELFCGGGGHGCSPSKVALQVTLLLPYLAYRAFETSIYFLLVVLICTPSQSDFRGMSFLTNAAVAGQMLLGGGDDGGTHLKKKLSWSTLVSKSPSSWTRIGE